MGTIKTTNIETITGSGTLTLGQSGETISVPSGATLDLSSATQTGVGGTNTPAFKVYLSSNQSVTNSTDTKINLNTEVFDTDNAFDNTTNYRFTVPSGKGGKYYFGYQVWYFDANAGTSNFADVSLRINGSGNNTTLIRKYGSFTNQNLSFSGNTTLSLNDGDYVEMWSYTQFTSGTNTIKANNTVLQGYKIIE